MQSFSTEAVMSSSCSCLCLNMHITILLRAYGWPTWPVNTGVANDTRVCGPWTWVVWMDPNCIMDRLLSKSQHTRTCIILQFLEIGHLVSWSEGCVLGLICNLTCIVLWPHMPVILCTSYVFWVPSPTVSLIIVKKPNSLKRLVRLSVATSHN